MTAWTNFLRQWSSARGISYSCAMTMDECKSDWQAFKDEKGLTKTTKKRAKAAVELERAPIPFNSRPVATSAVEYPSVFPTAASAQKSSLLPIHFFPLELAYPDADVVVKRVHIPKRAYAQIASIPVDPVYPLGPVPTFNLSTQTRAIMETMTPVRGDAVDTQVDKETADFWNSLGVDMSDMRGDTVVIKKKGKKKSEIDVSKSAVVSKIQKDMFAPALDMLLQTPEGMPWAKNNVVVMAKLIDMLARKWDGEATIYTGWEFKPSETFPVHFLGEMARLRDDMLKSNNGLTDCFYELLRQGDVNWDIGYSGGIGQKKSVKVYWKSGKSKKVIAEQKSHLKYLNDTIDWSDILERANVVDVEKKAEADQQKEVAKGNKESLGVEIIRGLFLDRPDLADAFLAELTPAKIHKAMKAVNMSLSGVNALKEKGSLYMLARLYTIFRIENPEEKYKQLYRLMLTALRVDITGDAPPDEEVLFEPAPEDDGVILK